ncbi:MAG: VWA domain-containing protein, partial [Chloroflexales bacterium]|nr:VWA domain-containing protein [Chloroflexales bacterium]
VTARIGPNSPTAPAATRNVPKRVSSMPRSRSIGMRVPIAVVDLSSATGGPEAMLTRLEAPAHAHDGQELALDAVIGTSVAQDAEVLLMDEGREVERRPVSLILGENRVRFLVKARGSGFQRYSVALAAPRDTQPVNNEAVALVQIEGPPSVLVVAPEPAEAQALIRALAATKLEPRVVAPAAMPTELAGLGAYEAVILVNTPASSLPVGAMAALPAYVRDLGKGLLMIGGDESFGVGGYGRTPVEEALPVYMDVRDREERPDLALVFVIDKSGSMDACHCASPERSSSLSGAEGLERKVDIAKQAVADAAALLREHDTIGVITFDRAAYETLPATRGASIAQVVSALESVQPRGSTNVRQGLLAAGAMLARVDARIKHVILLTDGWGAGGSNLDLAGDLHDQGVTLSVVAAGGGSADYLEQMAAAGGGRYYPVVDIAEVPQIFVQETIATVGNYVVERPFTPVAIGESPIMAGIGGLPTLYGFNGSTIKDSARLVLEADDGQPLLATWQFGLGRSAAWLSDAKGQWAADWVRWAGFPRFAGQMVGAVLPVRGGQDISTEMSVAGGETTIVLSTGEGQENLAVTATLIGTDGSRREVPLPQVGPNSYQGRLESPAPGTYLVQISGAAADRTVLQETAGLVVPYSS